jgi:hypothetical protein
MNDTQVAFLAGFVSGRGSFGVGENGRSYLYLKRLDPGIAEAALRTFGGTSGLAPL